MTEIEGVLDRMNSNESVKIVWKGSGCGSSNRGRAPISRAYWPTLRVCPQTYGEYQGSSHAEFTIIIALSATFVLPGCPVRSWSAVRR